MVFVGGAGAGATGTVDAPPSCPGASGGAAAALVFAIRTLHTSYGGLAAFNERLEGDMITFLQSHGVATRPHAHVAWKNLNSLGKAAG